MQRRSAIGILLLALLALGMATPPSSLAQCVGNCGVYFSSLQCGCDAVCQLEDGASGAGQHGRRSE